MESVLAFRRSPRTGLRWIPTSLGFAMAILWPTLAWGNCMENLQGKIYTNLPQPICPRYTDILLGHSESHSDPSHEYAGVICDRPEASYILLQKLVKYTEQGKAVWQIVQVKTVPKSPSESYVRAMGCELKSSSLQSSPLQTPAFSEPVFALVQPTVSDTYLTLTAWKVNLQQESFTDVDPTQVICKNSFL